jgi:predicted PurR-regulated permease PerM
MPDYRIGYSELPWGIVFAIVISKTFTFFIMNPIVRIMDWFTVSEYTWLKRIKLIAVILLCCLVFFGIVLLSVTLSGTTLSVLIRDILSWLSEN